MGEVSGEDSAAVGVRPSIVRPSASKAKDLLACSWPWGRERDRTTETTGASEPATYGQDFHAIFAHVIAVCKKRAAAWDRGPRFVPKAITREMSKETVAHAAKAWPVLVSWLRRDNPWNVDLTKGPRIREELPMALDMHSGNARQIPPHDANHVYRVTPNELPGTADLLIDMMPDVYRRKGVPHAIIIDHKTGDHIDLPQDSAQLKTLALTYDAIAPYKSRELSGVIFHAPRGMPSTVYEWTYDADDLARFLEALNKAWGHIGDGSMRPGPQCRFCQVALSCPTQASVLNVMVPRKTRGLGTPEVTTLNGKMTPELLGAQHAAIQQVEAFAKKWREAAAEWIRENGPGVREDGSLVVLKEKSYEGLSKASIVRALGREKGEREIERLRKLGCTETQTREEMHAVKE